MRPLAVHPGIRDHSRLVFGDRAGFRAWELAILFLCGAAAVVAAEYLELPLRRQPGKAILQSMIPAALGLAAVPRYGAGSLMSLAGMLSVVGLHFAPGFSFGYGSTTSACATGICLDVMLLGARRGWWLYLGIVGAGLLSNLIAMGMRALPKLWGWEGGAKRGLGDWFSQAIWSYPLCGLIAGTACAVVFFSLRDRRREEP
jgi:hypothetical protein